VYVISTGGTFEKAYHPIRETFDFHEGSIVAELLESACVSDPALNVLMARDSLNMSNADRAQINRTIEKCGYDRIVIVHGTSKMVDTAEALNEIFPEKTIVLTGALKPYRYSATEAAFNLGGAIAAAQILPAGIFIVMHGQIIPGNLAQKDPQTGRFSEKKGSGGPPEQNLRKGKSAR
jgi:L-asparaginase